MWCRPEERLIRFYSFSIMQSEICFSHTVEHPEANARNIDLFNVHVCKSFRTHDASIHHS